MILLIFLPFQIMMIYKKYTIQTIDLLKKNAIFLQKLFIKAEKFEYNFSFTSLKSKLYLQIQKNLNCRRMSDRNEENTGNKEELVFSDTG